MNINLNMLNIKLRFIALCKIFGFIKECEIYYIGSSEVLPPPLSPVSYTHLDVYKRQVQEIFFYQAVLYKIILGIVAGAFGGIVGVNL